MIKVSNINKYVKAWLSDEEKLDKLIGDKDYSFGWTNELWRNKRRIGWIVFMDYDGKELDEVVSDCKKLQDEFKLGNGIVLKTTHGYHLYILDVVDKKMLVKIMRASKSDKLYLKMGVKSNYQFNIRLGRKYGEGIQYTMLVPSEHNNKFSLPHYRMLVRKYPKFLYDELSLKSSNYSFVENWVNGALRFTVYRIKKPRRVR